MGKADNFWVIGVGSSAGGLEALQALVSNLPKDLPAALIVAQHLAPHAKSMLVELLARHSTLAVGLATDGEAIKPNRIYIVPPNHDADIGRGHIRLRVAGNETRPKPSVDALFESIAHVHGERSVGIILSGTGNDGTRGIQAIHAAGGLTLAQDDLTARYDGMPKSAVESGDVFSVQPPHQLAKELHGLLVEHALRRRQLREDEMTWVRDTLDLLRQHVGLNFTQYKMPTVRRRIEKHMRTTRHETPREYVEHLKNNTQSLEELSQELFISVTSFFRDPDAFATLGIALEKAVASKPAVQHEFRIWVAGCATGEEAYSIAILASDVVRRAGRPLRVKVFATDLDQDALIEARAGVYSAEDVASVKQIWREEYFRPRGEQFEVDKSLRDIVVFARQDLGQSAPFVKMDLVTCRNVMIYFAQPLQARVFELFHYALNRDGLLFLGKSESVNEAAGLFEVMDRRAKLFRKLNVMTKALPSAIYAPAPVIHASGKRGFTAVSPMAELAQKEVLQHYEVSGAVIDDDLNLLHVVGSVSAYVTHPEGQATLNISQMLPKGVGTEIPVLIRKVRATGEAQRSRAYAMPRKAKRESFYIHLRPLGSTEARSARLFLIIFEARRIKRGSTAVPAAADQVEQSARVAELENELGETKEHLQTVIEELGISNEELQSLNEELNSTNEELQSTNEELETTNEELQSTNEELTTLNEELGNKTYELRITNASLENIQNSIGSPMVVVDTEMRVVRFNQTAQKIFDISGVDIGRNVTRVSSHCEIPNFHAMVAGTLDNGRVSETLVERFESVFQLRVLPALDDARKITGAILIFFDNSALIRAEERLRTSEQRIRAIVDGSPSLVSLKDSLGRYLVVNQAFASFFDLEPAAMIGKSDRELFDGALAARMRDGDLEVLYKKEATRRDEAFKPGHVFSIARFPLAPEPGAQPYAVGMVALDVSERVRVTEELARSEARYRSIIEDQAVFVCRFDPQYRILFVNNTLAAFFGDRPAGYLDREFTAMVDGDERERLVSELARLTSQNPVVHLEHRVTRYGGDQRWVRWVLKAVTDQGGALVEVQAVGVDVTDNRREADRLQERETILSHIFSHTTDYLTVFRVTSGPEFILDSFNPSAEHAMGYSFTHLLGRNLKSLLDHDKYQQFLNKFDACLKTGEPQMLEEEMRSPGGVKHLLTTLVPIVDPRGKVERIASMSRDVSNFKRIQDELRAEKERAELANSTKSDFLAAMSHELRTPLNIVLGMAQLLADGELNTDEKKFVSSIQRSGQVLLSLIEDILDLSKVEEGQLRLERVPFSLFDLISEVADGLHALAGAKELVFRYQISDQIPSLLLGDPGRIRQILVNLVGNAIKFTDEGSVLLRVEADLDDGGLDPLLRLEIVDTGIGIKEDQFPRIFQKFSQADSGLSRRYGGTGLGLVICKRLVEMMDGEIGFESTWGKGSTFWFKVRLPIETKRILPPARPALDPAPSEHVPLRILAVDDNPDSQMFIQLLLGNLGHDAAIASSGREAIAKVRDGNFDLVLMDVQMPDLDGYETTAQIRELGGACVALPIVALTANAMAGDAEKCLASGMDDYLSKPVQKEALRALVRKWSRRAERTEHPLRLER